jgi:hypothetical protein
MAVSYPVKTSNVLTTMTKCTQQALQARTSRMEIELPPGSDFGVEASSSKASKRQATESTADSIRRSNREAARLVAEMFAVISAQTVALFPSEGEAADARVKWGPTFRGQCYGIDGGGPAASKAFGSNLYSKRASKHEIEQQLLSSGGLYIPAGTELVIVAGPRAKDIKKLQKMHEQLGEATCVILVNARAAVEAAVAKADDGSGDWVSAAFTNVFHYAPPLLPPATSSTAPARDLLLYHEYGSNWYLAEKEKKKGGDGLLGAVGGMLAGGSSPFTTLWEGPQRPTADQLKAALAAPAPANTGNSPPQ